VETTWKPVGRMLNYLGGRNGHAPAKRMTNIHGVCCNTLERPIGLNWARVKPALNTCQMPFRWPQQIDNNAESPLPTLVLDEVLLIMRINVLTLVTSSS
jgi:hypothetical protein